MNGEVQAAREGRDEVGLYARTLGNYHLLRLLGRGRTGEVYLGEQVQRGTPAAVKLFWLHLMKEERHIFLDGMQAIAAYLHPHVRHSHLFCRRGNRRRRNAFCPMLS